MTRYGYAGAALAVTLLATSAAGATDGTVYERFQQWIEANPPPPDTFVYESVEPLGDDGLVFEGLSVTEPGQEPVTIERVAVSSLDFDAVEAGTPPLYVAMDVTGMRLPAADLDDAFGSQDALGVDTVMVDLAVDYRLDEAAQTLSLSPLTVTLRDLGTIEVNLDLAGIDPGGERTTGAGDAGGDAQQRVGALRRRFPAVPRGRCVGGGAGPDVGCLCRADHCRTDRNGSGRGRSAAGRISWPASAASCATTTSRSR